MIQISVLTIILSFDFVQKQKIPVINFALGAVRQAFCKPSGFVPPCSMGALVTLHYVGTVAVATDSTRNHMNFGISDDFPNILYHNFVIFWAWLVKMLPSSVTYSC